jgi:hypothetical protein
MAGYSYIFLLSQKYISNKSIVYANAALMLWLQLWQDITSGASIADPSLLSRFFLLSYAVSDVFVVSFRSVYDFVFVLESDKHDGSVTAWLILCS